MAGYDSFEYKLSEAARKFGQELDKAMAEFNKKIAEIQASLKK